MLIIQIFAVVVMAFIIVHMDMFGDTEMTVLININYLGIKKLNNEIIQLEN